MGTLHRWYNVSAKQLNVSSNSIQSLLWGVIKMQAGLTAQSKINAELFCTQTKWHFTQTG